MEEGRKNGGMREGEKDYCWRRESEKSSKVGGKRRIEQSKSDFAP